MKSRKRIKFLSLLTLAIMVCIPAKTFAFGSQTHYYVTKTCTKKLGKMTDDLKKSKNLSEKETSILEDITRGYKNTIIDYSLKPDEDENQGSTYKHHFYNPVTEKNFLGEKKNALSKCKEHYTEALKYYKEGDKISAYEQLGRAVHFLEDSNTPVHTGYDSPTDSVIKLPLHVRYEKKCDMINFECDAKINIKNLDYYKVNSVETIVKASAVLAMDNFYRLENIEKTNDDELAKNAVLNAQKNVVGLLYKFIVEAGK